VIYYLARYIDNRVIALEPNDASYQIAKINLYEWRNRVVLLKKGLWSRPCKLKVSDGYTGARTSECGEKTGWDVESTDVNTILRNHGWNHIDILKLDIEGAEAEVLLNGEEWLPRTRMLLVEFHVQEIRKKCTAELEKFGFKRQRHRSVFCFQKPRI
jgi:FkbM family methyltransferase